MPRRASVPIRLSRAPPLPRMIGFWLDRSRCSGGEDVDQRQPAGAGLLLARVHLLHGDRDRVRQLVADVGQRRLPDQLGDPGLLGLVGGHAVGVELRAGRQPRDQQAGQQLDLVAGPGRDRHDLGELPELADRQQLLGDPLLVDRVGLGDDRDHRRLERLQLGRDEPVAGADLVVGRDAEADHVDLGQRLAHHVVEPLAEQGARAVQSRRVDDHQLAVGRLSTPRTARRVVCGLSLVMTILDPTSALVRVDLPALGRPTKAQKPERYARLVLTRPFSPVHCLSLSTCATVAATSHWFT